MKEPSLNKTRGQKHVLIFGGTKGLGWATAKLFTGAGWQVSIVGRNPPADRLNGKDAHNIRYFALDLLAWAKRSGGAWSQAEDINSTLENIIAGRGFPDSLIFCQRYRGAEDQWAGEWEVSLTATKQAIEFLAGKPTGKRDCAIVITSSIAGEFVVSEQPLSYHVAKAALNQLIRYYAVTLGAQGIRVNGVSPGMILKEESRAYYLKNKSLSELYRKITPLGRMITAEEIAAVIFFLCSPAASAITGQNLIVDGGLSLRGQAALAKELKGI
ncbi:MAG: SDR family oxidoreductase [Lentisphaerae bacterium]|nr:SDR family oxidoreductase [Lentisphaerota bacterium]